ncbi:MAG: hypothetical protein MI806_12475, partial [Minwuiales bacterium]|nr:hypothetical protein [Minwuiales bacterium]
MPQGYISGKANAGRPSVEQLLQSERDLDQPDVVTGSALRTKIKRANLAEFARIVPTDPLKLAAGIRQNRDADIPNKFRNAPPQVQKNAGFGNGAAYDDEDAPVGAAGSLLYGQGAAYDDENVVQQYFTSPESEPAKQAPRGSGPQVISDDAGSEDFAYKQLGHFAVNTRNNFADRRDRPQILSKDDYYKAIHYKAAFDRYMLQDEAEDSGVSDRSPLSRTNAQTRFPKDFQRNFFQERFSKEGYYSADYFEAKDDATWKQKFELARQRWNNAFGNSTKAQRGAFALDMALSSAAFHALKEHEKDRPEPYPLADKQQSSHDYGDQKAKALDYSEKNRERFRLLTRRAIEKGVRELDYFLDPKNDPNEHFAGSASRSEREQLKEKFRDWCNEYNAVVEDRIALRQARRDAMSESALTELGMPVTMPEALASRQTEALFEKTENEFIKSRDFSYWKSLVAVVLHYGTLTALGRCFKWIRKHVDNVAKEDKLNKQLGEAFNRTLDREFDARIKDHLFNENYVNARDWIHEQYAYERDNLGQVGMEELFDPHRFYAAAAHFSKDEVVRNIKEQLTRSAGFDPKNPPGVTDERYLEYCEFNMYVGEMARGVFEGMRDALTECAEDQLKLRVVARMTADAKNYVIASNTLIRYKCTRSWQELDNILDDHSIPSLRKQWLSNIERNAQAVQNVDDDLSSADSDTGTFVSLSAFGKDEFQEYTLPPDHGHRKLLEDNIAAGHRDIAHAREVAQRLDEIFGQYGDPTALHGIKEDLVNDFEALAYTKDSAGTPDEVTERFDKMLQSVDTLKHKASALERQLSENQSRKLNGILSELEYEIGLQRRLHSQIADVGNQLLNARSADDVTKEGSPAALFSARMIFQEDPPYLDERYGAGVPESTRRKLVNQIRHTVEAEIRSTSELFTAHEAAQSAIGSLEEKVRSGLPLRDAVASARQAISSFGGTRNAHIKQNLFNEALVEKFDSMTQKLDESLTRLLPVSLGVPSNPNATMSKDAVAMATKLFKADLDSDVVVDALKTELASVAGAKEPTIANVEAMLLNIGNSVSSVTAFADKIFADRPELSLNFQIGMMRQNGATEEDLAKLRQNFFTRKAQLTVFESQPAVNRAYNRIFTNVQAAASRPKSHPSSLLTVPSGTHPSSDTDDDDPYTIESDYSSADDDNGDPRPAAIGPHG